MDIRIKFYSYRRIGTNENKSVDCVWTERLETTVRM